MNVGHYNAHVCSCDNRANPDCMQNGCKLIRNTAPLQSSVDIKLDLNKDNLVKKRIDELQVKTLLMPGEELELNILLSHWWGLNR